MEANSGAQNCPHMCSGGISLGSFTSSRHVWGKNVARSGLRSIAWSREMHTRRIGLGNKSLLPSDPYAPAYLTAGCLVISLILISG